MTDVQTVSDVTLERHFKAPPETVFEFVTRPENTTLWWGHDGWTMEDCALDFTRTGPWHMMMRSEEGNLFHVSGEVLEVAPPDRVRFTWAWHDDAGARGFESEVRFSVTPEGGGARFVLHHTGLPGDEIAARHEGGWIAVLSRLERHFPT